MKRLLTILAMLLLAAGFSFEGFAADAFDASSAGEYAVSAEAETVEAESVVQDEAVPLFLFTRSIKSAAQEFLHRELGINAVHGQPLPGVLISLLLGAAFGLARKIRKGRRAAETEQQPENALVLTARLLRMQISYLYPPETIHTISPGPDLFCQRE
jgi:hypothetical protein